MDQGRPRPGDPFIRGSRFGGIAGATPFRAGDKVTPSGSRARLLWLGSHPPGFDMPPTDQLLPFLLATSLFALVPGPGMLYMAVRTLAHGARAGWSSSAAFHLASYLHILLAAFGVSALLQTAPILALALKLAGASWLVWMGCRLLVSGAQNGTPSVCAKPDAPWRTFRDSLVVEILNPKSALFYLALLPQFVSTEAGAAIWLQMLVLGTIANAMFSLTDAVCILSARLVANRTSLPMAWARRTSGAVLIAIGARMAAPIG